MDQENELTLLGFDDISSEILTNLIKMVKICPYKTTVSEILNRAADGENQLWGFESGVIVTKLSKHPAGLELTILGFEGTFDFTKAFRLLEKQAKKYKARWIGGLVGNPRVARLAQRQGLKTQAEHMMKEI